MTISKVIVLMFLSVSVSLFAGGLDIIWISDPVKPNEAVLVSGWDFSKPITVEVGRLKDSTAELPKENQYQVDSWHRVEVLQPGSNAFKFVLPSQLQQGIFACRVSSEAGSDIQLINSPDAWWVQGSNDTQADAGSWIRVFGKSLSFNNVSASVAIQPQYSEDYINLVLQEQTPEQLWAKLPDYIKPGNYDVYVHNGFGGDRMWINAGEIEITKPSVSKPKIYNIADYGIEPAVARFYSWNPDMFAVNVDLSDKLQKVFDKAGQSGGVVYLPRGVYSVSKMLTIPENITIRGAGKHLTAIQFSDVDPPRPSCLYGTSNFTIEDISIYALNHYAVIRGNSGINENSGNIKIRNVILRADRFLTTGHARHYDNYKEIFYQRLEDDNRVAVLNFGGKNIEIIDCDIYSSRLILGLDKVSGVIRGNRFTSRPEHWNIFIRGANRLIYENNYCSNGGVSISNVHHSPHFDSRGVRINQATPTFRASYVYCRNNEFLDSYTKDRDGGVNSDYHGPVGLYFGKPQKVDRAKITLAGDFWSTPNDSMLGAAVIITDGKGAGQFRNVVSYEGDNGVVVDEHFKVEPDESSWIAVSKSIDHQIYVDNTISDAGNGIFFWCGGLESIAARNKIIRAGTVNVNSIYHTGMLPAVNLQFIENEIVEGLNWGPAYIHLRGSLIGAISYPPPYTYRPEKVTNQQPHYHLDRNAPDYHGPMTMMQVIRNNRILNNGSYYIGGMVDNALLDGNFIADSDIGVEISNRGGRWQDWFEGGPTNILVRGTELKNVVEPIRNEREEETLILQ